MKQREVSLWRAGILAALLSIVAVQSGCLAVAAGAAGAGTVAYIRGELNASIDGSQASVSKAARGAIEDLKFVRISETSDALVTILIARTADDTRVDVRVERVTDTLSKVRVRVGVFGDERVSQLFLERLKAQL